MMKKHGKHCNCMMCSAGRMMGMIKECNDGKCMHPSHEDDQLHNRDHDYTHVQGA